MPPSRDGSAGTEVSDLLKRILVAVVLAPLFFVVLFFLEPVVLAVLMAAICALASFELLRATKVPHHNGMYVVTALSAAARAVKTYIPLWWATPVARSSS